MPLARQTVPVSLRQGVDTKSDPKQVVPGRLLILENGVLTKLGSVQKRNGYAVVAASPASGMVASALSTMKGQLFMAGSGAGYSYSAAQNQWVASGPCEALQITTTPVVRNVYQQTTQDSATHAAGVQVVAWEDSSTGFARYSVVDVATGQAIVANAQLGTSATRPRCAVLGNYLIVVYYETTSNHIRYVAIPVRSPASPLADADVAINPNTNQVFDVQAIGDRVFVAYANTVGGTTQASVRFFSTSFVVSNELLVGVAALPDAVAVWGSTDRVYVAYHYGSTNLAVATADYNLTSLDTPLVVGSALSNLRNLTGVLGPDGHLSTILHDVTSSPSYNSFVRASWINYQPNPPSILTSTTATTGGGLAAGAYYYVVVAAYLSTAAVTLASSEVSIVTTGATSTVTLTWTPVVGADRYFVYRGTSPGGENVRYAVVGATSFTDTGAAGTSAAPSATNTFVGATSATTVAQSVGLASKPWSTNGTVHFVAGYTSALQSTYFLMSIPQTTVGLVGGFHLSTVVGQIAPGVAGGVTAKPVLPGVTQTAAGVFSFAHLRAHQVGAAGGVVLSQTGVDVAALDFTAPQMAVELSDNLHVTGGLLYSFDGRQVAEHNFLLYPENVAATPSGTGGSILAGQYQYAVVFEWWDAFGLHQSGVSVPVTVTTAGSTSSVALTIPTLRVTNRQTPVGVAVYRTAANGSVFYRITSPTSPLLNSTTANTVSYTDTVADASIIGNAQLYTTGGEVENVAAPAPGAICNYNNRIMLVSSENPLTVWFSKQVTQGVPVEFSPSFQFNVDQRGGPVVAMAQMDDKLVMFKRRWIFALVGDGPAANGTPVPAYPPASIVTADSGCKSPKSLVLIPTGLMYQSEKGIYLLGRDLSTTYIGAPVEAYNAATVTSAQQAPSTTQVRFTLDTGTCLVYDWLVDQWSVFTGVAAADATVFNGVFTYCQAGGTTLAEAPGTFTDAGNAIRLRLQTSWLSFAGIQDMQRVWEMLVLGEYRSTHNLRVSVAYDFDPTPHQVVTINAGSLLDQPVYGVASPYGVGQYGGAFPLYQFRVKMQQERCQTVQITVEDVQSPPYGEGAALSAFSFVVGTLGTAKKVPANRTFGA